MRDLDRARHAFKEASAVAPAYRKEYRSRAHGLGPAILRHGLAAAITFLEREGKESAAHILLGHIAGARLSGLNDASAATLPDKVRALGADAYVLATRETLRLCLWLRRAVQAWSDAPQTGAHDEARETQP
jgi:CRISPR-associated protein Cmr5